MVRRGGGVALFCFLSRTAPQMQTSESENGFNMEHLKQCCFVLFYFCNMWLDRHCLSDSLESLCICKCPSRSSAMLMLRLCISVFLFFFY